ncbi:MAG TPA: hypothetical protein VIJ79_15075 [Acidobacteriaceae bacterium]
MPIQIVETGSIFDVQRDLRAFEVQYDMSSDEFLERGCVDGSVSEFDAIEWNFLLMQKKAMEPEGCVLSSVFSARCQTRIGMVDISDVCERIAA